MEAGECGEGESVWGALRVSGAVFGHEMRGDVSGSGKKKKKK